MASVLPDLPPCPPGLAHIADPYDLLSPEDRAELVADLRRLALLRQRVWDSAGHLPMASLSR